MSAYTQHMFTGAATVTWIADDDGEIICVSFTTLDNPEVLDEADEHDLYGSDEDVLVKMLPKMQDFLEGLTWPSEVEATLG